MKLPSSHNRSNQFAVGTLALGKEFVTHAILLAGDLLIYHPDIKFYVYTDSPKAFSSLQNVIPFPHTHSGVKRCYHDKRFVIQRMLETNEACMFLDADSRLLSEINITELLNTESFITCLHSTNLLLKLETSIAENGPRSKNKKHILGSLAQIFGLNFQRVTFITEALMVFNRSYANTEIFFSAWEFCARYTALRLFEYSEGSSVGLAAEFTGATIATLNKNPNWLFKDQLEDYKHKNESEAVLSRKLICVRRALEANYKKKTHLFLKIPQYFIGYLKNLLKYRSAKRQFEKVKDSMTMLNVQIR